MSRHVILMTDSWLVKLIPVTMFFFLFSHLGPRESSGATRGLLPRIHANEALSLIEFVTTTIKASGLEKPLSPQTAETFPLLIYVEIPLETRVNWAARAGKGHLAAAMSHTLSNSVLPAPRATGAAGKVLFIG